MHIGSWVALCLYGLIYKTCAALSIREQALKYCSRLSCCIQQYIGAICPSCKAGQISCPTHSFTKCLNEVMQVQCHSAAGAHHAHEAVINVWCTHSCMNFFVMLGRTYNSCLLGIFSALFCSTTFQIIYACLCKAPPRNFFNFADTGQAGWTCRSAQQAPCHCLLSSLCLYQHLAWRIWLYMWAD